jgi:hypothetical protein
MARPVKRDNYRTCVYDSPANECRRVLFVLSEAIPVTVAEPALRRSVKLWRADHRVGREGNPCHPTGADRSSGYRRGAAPFGATRSVDHGRSVPRRLQGSDHRTKRPGANSGVLDG